MSIVVDSVLLFLYNLQCIKNIRYGIHLYFLLLQK
jgi:hypothetical protein